MVNVDCDMGTYLAGVGLGRDGVGGREASLLAEDLEGPPSAGACRNHTRYTHLVEFHNLAGIPLKKLQEGCLGAGGALGAAELELLAHSLDILQVHHQLLDPLRRALAYVALARSHQKRLPRWRAEILHTDGDELGLWCLLAQSVAAKFHVGYVPAGSA